MTVTPYTPQQFLALAKQQIAVTEKITLLKRVSEAFPTDQSSQVARDHLVKLLISHNRFDEALQIYRQDHPEIGAGKAIDFRLLDLLLRTGRYNEVLRATVAASGPERDFLRDMQILEVRVQAFLAKGQFQLARECLDEWMTAYAKDGAPGTRFESDVQSLRFLQRHLRSLERQNGPKGKSIFTASVPDSLRHWSRRHEVPIVFFKLIPAHTGGQMREPLLAGRHEGKDYFEKHVEDLNRGFAYVSGQQFSLQLNGLQTLYVKEGDLDPASSGAHLLTSRVYVHTIPQLYKLAGEAFVILVDYREQADGEAAYMGDGIIHLSASKLSTLVVMHEILHGLGATHQEWRPLEVLGYKFDPEDRGLMTFERGQIVTLGLEEKNRALLGWPAVGAIRPRLATGTEFTERLRQLGSAVSDVEPSPAPPASPLRPTTSGKTFLEI